MTESRDRLSVLPLILVALGGIAVGVLAATLLPGLPFGGHGDPEAAGAADPHAGHDHGELWTCGMHPEVLQEEPGSCPICGMDLVPVQASAPTDEGALTGGTGDQWACTEHPDRLYDEAGECPIDGLPLEPVEAEREVLFYRNPMDPTITSPVPAQDSMGMDYVPVYADEARAGETRASGATVSIDPTVVQNMNVRTETVGRRDLGRPIRTVGYLEFDQQRMVTVTPKYQGWIEKVYVNYVGEDVRRGQPLFEIYSPELVQTELELLSALEFAESMSGAPEDARQRAESLVEAARERLAYWDVSPRQIAELEETGEIFRTLQVRAPAGGLVMKRMAGLEGMAVKPGMELFHIADLRSLWLSVELFEDQVAWVRQGTPAEISLAYFPGETFRGRVRFLEPQFSEETRTMRAKIEVPNPQGRLKQGMYATVVFSPIAVEQAVAVPSEAVLRTGQRNVVILALGGGRFEPRQVILGLETEGFAQVLEGLEEGDRVVTSAQFLLDSESRLQEAIQKMIAQRRAGDRS